MYSFKDHNSKTQASLRNLTVEILKKAKVEKPEDFVANNTEHMDYIIFITQTFNNHGLSVKSNYDLAFKLFAVKEKIPAKVNSLFKSGELSQDNISRLMRDAFTQMVVPERGVIYTTNPLLEPEVKIGAHHRRSLTFP